MKTIKAKLFLPIFFMFIFFTTVLVAQVTGINKNLEEINEINDKFFTTLVKAEQLKLNVVQVQQWLTDISATRASEGLDDGFDEAAKHAKSVDTLLIELGELNPERKQQLTDITNHFHDYYDSGKKMAQAYIDGGPEQGNLMMEQFDSDAAAINDDVDALVEDSNIQVETAIHTIKQITSNMIIVTVISIVLSLLICAAVWILVSKKVIKPISLLLKKLESLSEHGGDLTQQLNIDTSDEIGGLAKATNKFIDNIRSIVTNVKQSSSQAVASAEQLATHAEETGQKSNEIANSIGEIADGSAKQAEHAEKILKMMEETAIEVSNGRNQAATTLSNAKKSSLYAREGNEAINDAIDHLRTITATVNDAAQSVQNLGKRSEEIGGIITAISAISEQTNLLALNAAIEAARAGEAGKGFAVVAEEVRKLAEQASQSSKQITELIKSIQTETINTVALMEKNLLEVKNQEDMIEKSRASLKNIVVQVEETEIETQNINELLIAFNEKAQNVLIAIQEISSISEESASSAKSVAEASEEQFATIEEISASSVELAQLAESLQKQVNRFTV
ncbi:methyl-accepting chemotaxis protein [Calidifontibacillus oryziterrae]|uniref:methyl-accepting chemotaxis protein n=1 Tax=Calidifontibacillus oryziterrae TaxID=1191699 RepID=UPI0002E46019|nr:methyl-accepting chemotaxis protein [Calidifontibacillus oryziterrae]